MLQNEDPRQNNIVLICASVTVTFIFLLFKGDTAWFIKVTGLNTALLLNSIVIFNLTRRRHFRIQKLGFFQLCLWASNLFIHVLDEMLTFFNINIFTDLIFYITLITLTLIAFAYKEISEWKKKRIVLKHPAGK